MVKILQPYIVTSWHGHRDDWDIPAAVQTIWRDKFGPGRGPQQGGPRQSNIDLAILNSKGTIVHWFDGFQHQGRKPQSLVQYTIRELQKATSRLRLRNDHMPRQDINLPDLYQSRGVRVIVSLKDDRMRAYRAPIVEVVPLNKEDWKSLEYSKEQRTVKAATLTKWLSQVYPPGVMERTNPRTKEVYRVKSVDGDLIQLPAGFSNRYRYARLNGKIRLTDEGPDGFSYNGKLEIVLAYENNDANVYALRGVFEGIYPRFDRVRNETRNIPLEAVFESRPN